MKRLKIKINFSNRWLYTFIILGIIAIVGVGVYAAYPASGAGHNANEIDFSSAIPAGTAISGAGRLHIQAAENLYLNPWSGSGPVIIGGGGGSGNLYVTGKVGIGTTNPQAKLSVGGAGSSSYAISGLGGTHGVSGIGSTIGVSGSGDYGVYGSGTTFGVYGYASNSYGVYGSAPNNGVRGEGGLYGLYGYGTQAGVRAAGGSYAGYMSGKFYVTGTCSGSSSCDQDIAEKWVSEKALEHLHCGEDRFDYLDEGIDQDMKEDYQYTCVLDSDFKSEFENGDVVCFESAMDSVTIIKFCEKAYDKKALSTISYNATIKFGPEYYPYPVALAGNIPIKVICDNPIEIGDSLVTSDVPGYAMKLDISDIKTFPEFQEKNDAIFAKALEPCDSGRKIIRAWI